MMRSLAIQLLASIIVFIGPSSSQENGEGRGRNNDVVVEKKINVKEIIRFGGRKGDEEQGKIAKFDAPSDDDSFVSSLLKGAANVAGSRKKFPWSRKLRMGSNGNNTGTAIVCGPEGAHINISWTPKIIDPEKPVMVYFDIENPINFNKGQASVDVYMQGSSDPIFSISQDVACKDLSKVSPFLTCPLKKGDIHKFSFKYTDVDRLPVGSYVLVAKVYSNQGNPPPLFACLNFTMQIIPSQHKYASQASQIIL